MTKYLYILFSVDLQHKLITGNYQILETTIHLIHCTRWRKSDSRKSRKGNARGPFDKGYLVLIEHQGVEAGQSGQAEVVPKQVVVHHQLLQLSEHSEASE